MKKRRRVPPQQLNGAEESHFNVPRRNRLRFFVLVFSIVVPLIVCASTVYATDLPPSIAIPNIFSLQDYTPRVDSATGAFTQRISLDMPPGRGNIQPNLTLDYNSQSTEQDSPVGYGWSLSIPYIERLNKTGSQNLYSNDAKFTSSLDGELVAASTTTTVSVSTSTIDDLSNNLVAYWKLDETSGDASDATGNGYTLRNNNSTPHYSGLIQNDIDFGSSNSNNYLQYNNTPPLHGSSDYTINLWVRINAAPSSGTGYNLFKIENDSSPKMRDYIYYYNQSGTLKVISGHLIGYADSGVTATYTLPTSNWTMITVVYRAAGGETLYINGTSVGANGATGDSGITDRSGMMIGADLYGYLRATAAVDETGVWSRALSGTEISSLYNDGSGKAYPLTLLQTSTSTTVSSIYAARVDDGSFRQYQYSTSTNSWTMYDKSGNKYLFGASSQSQQSATTSPNQVYKWMLEKITDTNGNYIRYTYNKDDNQIYPYQIMYTGYGGVDGPTVITFATSTRSDTNISYKSGFFVKTRYVISQVTAAFNGSNVRRYALGYSTGNNGYRAMLASVQESGWDTDSNEATLPPTTFQYVSTTTPFVGIGPGDTSGAYATVDATGDGVNNDTRVYAYSYGGIRARIKNADSTYTDLTSGLPTDGYWAGGPDGSGNFSPYETGVRFIDVNADGKADIIRGILDATVSSTPVQEIYLNTYASSTGYGWAATSSWSGVVPQFAYRPNSSGVWTAGLLGDFNGDGLPDFVESLDPAYKDSAVVNGAYFGNGSAWDSATTTIFSTAYLPNPSPTGRNDQLVDINGDGLADSISSDSQNTYVSLNNGSTGWVGIGGTAWLVATTTLYRSSSPGTTYYDRGIRFLDINGDGLPDMIHSYYMPSYSGGSAPNPEVGTYEQVFLNTGNGWATSTAYNVSNHIVTGQLVSGQWNGDYAYNEYANWKGNGQQYQDVLSNVTYPKGGSMDVLYGYTTQTGLNPSLPYNILTVTKTVSHDGLGHDEEVDYSYSGGLQYLPSTVSDRKFGGFASTSETHADKKIVTYYNQGNGVSSSLGEQSDGYVQINHPYREDVLSPSGALAQCTLYRWDTYSHGDSTFVGLGRKIVQSYSSGATHRDAATDYVYATSTDDLVQMYEYGEVANGGGSPASLGAARNTLFTYTASTSVNLSVLAEKATYGVTNLTSSSGSGSVRVLVVGGGGGGGGYSQYAGGAGGGGGGGYQYNNSYSVSAQAYTVTVGAGGAGGTTAGGNGSSGGNSVFGTMTAYGGGGGGASNSQPGADGGSGGGAAWHNSTGGTGSQGYNGGGGGNAGPYGAGAGGGAGGVGANGTSSVGGAGGAGAVNDISGTSITYAGGGGGGGGDTAGAGGVGGGGAGSLAGNQGGNGTVNSGGGGGGAGGVGQGHSGAVGGSGGSGIVIIAAPLGTVPSATGGTHTTANGYDIWTFTSSGTWTPSGFADAIATSSTMVADEKHYYDNLAFGSVGVGNETKRADWIAGSTYASSTSVYNSHGLITQSTDRNGNATSYAYDSFDLYPATTTNALGQNVVRTFDYSNGKEVTIKNPNGGIIANSYDGVGRVTGMNQSDPTAPSSLLTKTSITYTDSTTTPSLVHKTDYRDASAVTEAYGYYDGLGRLIQERVSTEDTGTFAVADTVYDSAGRLGAKSLPYLSSGSSRTSVSTIGVLFTHYLYDPLGRTSSIANAVGTTTNEYSEWTTTATDPNGNVKDYTLDAYGNFVEVVEHNASSSIETAYAYDGRNNLVQITDGANNSRSFSYDGLSRRLSAQDLHTFGGGVGTSTYAYDDAGNTISQTDPKGQTITRTFDALNRPLTETWSGHGVQSSNIYDTCANGIGAVCTASSTGAVVTYAYDVLGRTTAATTTIAGTDYGQVYTYDRQGNLLNLTNANGAHAVYTYGTGGRIASIQRVNSGATDTVASSFEYSPHGLVASETFGSGVTTGYTYDPNALYRLTRILTTSSGGASSPLKVLVVGGGGGGGSNGGGGGGGGQVVYNGSYTVTGGTYAVTVGTGGAASTVVNNPAAKGGDSIFGTLTAHGGGGGGAYSIDSGGAPTTGSSGGGAGQRSNPNSHTGSSGASGTTGEGYAGGDSSNGGYAGGGGGGAGSAGGNGTGYWLSSNNIGGTGGDGIANSITGTSVYYGGGGGGGAGYAGSVNSDGGQGGGGKGEGTSSETPGTANTGGGGGGNWNGSHHYGDGGSGIVIIRYPTAEASNYTCSATTTTAGSDTICTFISSGSFTVLSSNFIKDLAYTYDANGNIVTRSDSSGKVAYVYDQLNRLLHASTTPTEATPYSQTFAYDALGNITGRIDVQPTTTPSIAFDNAAQVASGSGTSVTSSYTTGSGTNRLMLVEIASNTGGSSSLVSSVTYNGTALTKLATVPFNTASSPANAMDLWYLIAPDVGTHNLSINYSSSMSFGFNIATYSGVSQSSFLDTYATTTQDAGTTLSASLCASGLCAPGSWTILAAESQANLSAGQHTTARIGSGSYFLLGDSNGTSFGPHTMSATLSSSSVAGGLMLSIAPAGYQATTTRYAYTGTGSPNPDAVTSIGNGSATSTYSYDQNGNLTSISGATSATYEYDYRNRLATSTVNSVTTTYRYDAAGNRVSQTTGGTTTVYPSKYFSEIINGTTATSTEYVWNGDALLAYIEQALASGVATGTAKTYYVHPDNLGSTNVVTDSSKNVVSDKSYFPYGSIRTASSTASLGRGYIGQFEDGSGLDYLNARYYEANRGQFLSEDPSHLAIGNQSQLLMLTGKTQQSYLADPQSLNSYAYARSNPIVNKDPSGNFSIGVSYNGTLEGGFGGYSGTTASTNLNLVVDPSTRQVYVVQSVSGAVNSGYMNNYQSAPDNGKAPFILGLYGGAGFSVNYSPNMTNPNDIQGTQDSINVNVPLVSFSAQGAGTKNPTYSVSPGVKGVASVSQYPTYTQITQTYSVNQYVSSAASQIGGYYQAAIAGIQAQINSIQAKINELKSSSSGSKKN